MVATKDLERAVGVTDFPDVDEFWRTVRQVAEMPVLQHIAAWLPYKDADGRERNRADATRARFILAVVELMNASIDHGARGEWTARDHELAAIVGAVLNPSEAGHAAGMRLFETWEKRA